jgi:hypothetical protein
MDLPSTLNAARICYLAGKVYFVRALSLDGLSTVLAWLDDVLPGRSDRTGPPELGSDLAQAALNSAHGQVLLTWLALRDHGVSYDQAAELDTTELERVRLLSVLFATRRTADPEPSAIAGDVSSTWCGESMAALARDMGLEAVGRLSRDQFEWLMSAGEADRQHSPEAKGFAAAMDLYNAAVAAAEAAAAAEVVEVEVAA